MIKFFETTDNPLLLSLVAVAVLLLAWLIYRLVKGRTGGLKGAMANISFDQIDGLVIPSADEGEILIDHLLLTSKGLLILEVKDVQGVVFGGNKLQDWTVINDERRYTISNPQPALYDRVAAVRQIVRDVPVVGRILFMDGAEFTKGVPELVTNLAELVSEFSEASPNAAKFQIEAFKPHWELIRNEVANSGSR